MTSFEKQLDVIGKQLNNLDLKCSLHYGSGEFDAQALRKELSTIESQLKQCEVESAMLEKEERDIISPKLRDLRKKFTKSQRQLKTTEKSFNHDMSLKMRWNQEELEEAESNKLLQFDSCIDYSAVIGSSGDQELARGQGIKSQSVSNAEIIRRATMKPGGNQNQPKPTSDFINEVETHPRVNLAII